MKRVRRSAQRDDPDVLSEQEFKSGRKRRQDIVLGARSRVRSSRARRRALRADDGAAAGPRRRYSLGHTGILR